MNPLLARQLRRLGLDPETPPGDSQSWKQLLAHIDRSYEDAEKSRYLLERSLQVSSREMRDLYEELRRASAAREHQHENRLRAVVNSLNDGLCTLDLDGKVEFANATATRLLGAAGGDLNGSTILEHFTFRPDEAPGDTNGEVILSRVAAGNTFTDDTALLAPPGGGVVRVSCVLSPIADGDRVSGIVFLFRDLTDHHEALARIRRTEHHYRTLFHSIPIAVYEEDFSAVGSWLNGLRRAGVEDLAGYLAERPDQLRAAISLIQVRDVNPAVLELLEADSAAELLGPLNPAVFTEETLASMQEQLLAIWENRDAVHVELTGSTLKGNRLHAIFHWSVSRVGGRQDLSKVLVAVTDITARKEVEEQMAALIRSKDEFLASVSHELRTPLTAVHGSGAVLKEQWDELSAEEREELVAYIEGESRELANIVEDLLVAARADIGLLSVQLDTIDLEAEVRAALGTVRLAEAGRDIDVGGVSGRAVADPLRFRQIIRNLLTNAVRYGGTTVTVRSDTANGHALVLVSDDGAGIPPEDQDAVFEPYRRAHVTPGVPGSVGLGLTVARQLAVLMGGDLSYRHAQGLSTFELRLPAVPGAA